jgi:hypothetical protein
MADALASGLDSETVLSRRALNAPGLPVTYSGRRYRQSTPGAP